MRGHFGLALPQRRSHLVEPSFGRRQASCRLLLLLLRPGAFAPQAFEGALQLGDGDLPRLDLAALHLLIGLQAVALGGQCM